MIGTEAGPITLWHGLASLSAYMAENGDICKLKPPGSLQVYAGFTQFGHALHILTTHGLDEVRGCFARFHPSSMPTRESIIKH